jgi:hypothetical protein
MKCEAFTAPMNWSLLNPNHFSNLEFRIEFGSTTGPINRCIYEGEGKDEREHNDYYGPWTLHWILWWVTD